MKRSVCLGILLLLSCSPCFANAEEMFLTANALIQLTQDNSLLFKGTNYVLSENWDWLNREPYNAALINNALPAALEPWRDHTDGAPDTFLYTTIANNSAFDTFNFGYANRTQGDAVWAFIVSTFDESDETANSIVFPGGGSNFNDDAEFTGINLRGTFALPLGGGLFGVSLAHNQQEAESTFDSFNQGVGGFDFLNEAENDSTELSGGYRWFLGDRDSRSLAIQATLGSGSDEANQLSRSLNASRVVTASSTNGIELDTTFAQVGAEYAVRLDDEAEFQAGIYIRSSDHENDRPALSSTFSGGTTTVLERLVADDFTQDRVWIEARYLRELDPKTEIFFGAFLSDSQSEVDITFEGPPPPPPGTPSRDREVFEFENQDFKLTAGVRRHITDRFRVIVAGGTEWDWFETTEIFQDLTPGGATDTQVEELSLTNNNLAIGAEYVGQHITLGLWIEDGFGISTGLDGGPSIPTPGIGRRQVDSDQVVASATIAW